jgi:hypothetical protein
MAWAAGSNSTTSSLLHFGLTPAIPPCAQVADRCSECPDDQIDILQDRPFSWAPFDPKKPDNNPNAKYVNARDGLRGFRDPDAMRGTGEAARVWRGKND